MAEDRRILSIVEIVEILLGKRNDRGGQAPALRLL